MRRRRIGKAHPRLFKYLTIFGASLGILSSTTFAVVMGVDAAKGDLITDNLREYTASFSSEGTILSKKTYKRGEQLEIPENPTHEIDGESNYFFIGWDTNGNGFPDFVPTRAYYDLNAEAVYFRTGKFDLNFLDLLNMDLEDLLKLLQDLNIDWEQFMSMFNIDPETLMEWLMGQTVLTFEASPAPSECPTYFRSTSYGDFDYAKKSFKNPDYFDSSTYVSEGSISPLSYTAYKLKVLDDAGLLPVNFGFTNYDITFNAVEDYYPVPDCEYSNDMGEIIDSDAHYLKEPINNEYRTNAAYCPAFGYVIDLFNAIPLPGVMGRDERAYYRYALEHYTSIPQEYERVIDDMIIEQDWYEEELNQVDSIAAYVSGLGECSLFNDDGGVDVNSYLDSKKKSKDPVMDLINNKRGSDLDFNTTAVMLFRRLHIPARLVKGYVSIGTQRGENSISLFNQHYWCEIYVKGTGWMICDCMDLSAVTGTNPYESINQQKTPLENNHILERITVKSPTVTRHYVGDPLKTAGGYITAYFSDNTTSRVTLSNSTPGVRITGYDSSQLGTQDIEVSYTYEGVTKKSGWQVTVVEQNAKLESVDWDTSGAQTSYYQGEPFNISGITAIGHYDNGDIRDLTDRITIVGDPNTDMIGGPYEAVVSVTDTGVTKSTAFQYTVMERNPVAVTIIQLPNKLTYYVGEQLDVTGLVVEVEYKNGSIQTMTLEGLARDVSPDWLEFSVHQLNSATTNQVVEVMKYNSELGDYVRTSFEVSVEENPMESYEARNFKNEYYLGEYFDVDDFKSKGYILAQMRNGYQIKICEYDRPYYDEPQEYDFAYTTPFNVTAPTLDVVTNTKVATVSFDYDGVMYNVDVPISIKEYSADEYLFNEKAGVTVGPGATGFANSDLFTFTTDYVGTMYFRHRSYDSYTPRGWTLMYNEEMSYHPNSFIYDKARQVYDSSQVTIEYKRSFPNGVVPYYSNSNGQDNYESVDDVQSGFNQTYNFTNFELTADNIRRLSSTLIPFSSNNYSSEQTYRSTANYKYVDDGSYAYEDIQNYINQPGHYYYTSGSIDSMVNIINRVKSDLHSEFTYDPGFRYTRSDVDPVSSFFSQGVGGSKQFATVATLIFRHLGMKARYVTGFGARSNGGTTTVHARDLHAWCEVYFDGAGWVIVDPTYFDTGATSGSTGTYGAGFGGTGLYNFDKPIYSGVVSISYDYAAQFTEDTDVPPDDPSRWYAVYDDKDYTHVYTISLEAGSNQLPSYLEYRVAFDWYRNDVYLGTYYSTDKVPTVSYGQYRLVPHVVVYDKAAQCEVTGEHNYTLKYGTEEMEFYIQPAFVYVYVYGTKDSYSMNGTGTVTLNTTGSNPDITYTLVIPEDLPEKDLYTDLPATIQLVLSGYFEYTGEGGTIVISFENIQVEPNGYSYSGQYQWDEYNVITFIYFGEVVITP